MELRYDDVPHEYLILNFEVNKIAYQLRTILLCSKEGFQALKLIFKRTFKHSSIGTNIYYFIFKNYETNY